MDFQVVSVIKIIIPTMSIIIGMLFLEFIAWCWVMPKKSRSQVALAIVSMYGATILVGIVLHSIGRLHPDIEQRTLNLLLRWIPELPVLVTTIFVFFWNIIKRTIINTIIKYPIAWRFFGDEIDAKKLPWYLFVINLLSVGLGMVIALIYNYMFGSI